MQLSGGILYTLCLGAHGRHLLDFDQIRVLRQSLCLLRSGQLDVQDTILKPVSYTHLTLPTSDLV